MAITWKNIAGPNFGAANQLLSNASSQVGQGLQDITNVAKDVSDEQIRQYDKQADINTVDILSGINNLDAEGVKNFDISSAESNFGSQFNTDEIYDALNNRGDELRAESQLTLQNERDNKRDDLAQKKFDLNKLATESTMSINKASRERTEENFKQKEKFNSFIMNNKSKVGDIPRNIQEFYKVAKDAGLNDEYTNLAQQELFEYYDKTIGPSESDIQRVSKSVENYNADLEIKKENLINEETKRAEQNGYSPQLLEATRIKDDPTKTTAVLDTLRKSYDSRTTDTDLDFGAFEDGIDDLRETMHESLPEGSGHQIPDSVVAFFAKKSFEVGVVNDFFNFDKDSKEWKQYLKMLEPGSVDGYVTELDNINSAIAEAQAAGLKSQNNILSEMKNNKLAKFNNTATSPVEFNIQNRAEIRNTIPKLLMSSIKGSDDIKYLSNLSSEDIEKARTYLGGDIPSNEIQDFVSGMPYKDKQKLASSLSGINTPSNKNQNEINELRLMQRDITNKLNTEPDLAPNYFNNRLSKINAKLSELTKSN